jgi:DNA repair protein RecN (Recombination protein N)
MINKLQIKNYALIDELEINFSKGLTIITGETGAGKSILLGALGLIMGKRADTKVLYDESDKCVVEAFFDIEKYELRSFFEENDLDYDPSLIIRREITPSGKSRAFVNDTPVNLKILQSLSSSLVDLHLQFDTLDIHEVSFQLRMIDALADNQTLLAGYQEMFTAYQDDRSKLSRLENQQKRAEQETEFLQFQLDELQALQLQAGEQETLEEELERLTNAEDIKRVLSATFQHLTDSETAVISQLEELRSALNDIRKFDSRVGRQFERFENVIVELQDMSGEFEKIAETTEHDPERILETQQRLDAIYRLQNKHKVGSVEELLALQKEIENKLEGFGDLSAEINRLRKRIGEQEQQLRQLAEQLRERRMKVGPGFEKKVLGLLSQLSMEHARIQVEYLPLEELGPTGMDEINFLFAANPGSRLQLIKDVASGGELSRLTLVTKSLVASAIPLPTLIFDEIDTGISGHIALKMGSILRQLSNQHQVVSITHSPQVASKADVHYFVYKKIHDDRTYTKVRQLTPDERVRAIATMLSQNPPSESAIENARELLSIQ